MTPEQEAKRRYWRTTINRLLIGDTAAYGGVSVTRAARNRYVVTVNGTTHDIGGRAASVLTAATRSLSVIRVAVIDGQAEIELCSQCEISPRQAGRSYCRQCESALDRGYNHKRYLRLKAQRSDAA